MACSIPITISDLKGLIWNIYKLHSGKLVFSHIKNWIGQKSEQRCTSNLLLLTKPLSLQPFTLRLLLCLSLTERSSSTPLSSYIRPKFSYMKKSKKEQESEIRPVRQKASLHRWIFSQFRLRKPLCFQTFCKKRKMNMLILGYQYRSYGVKESVVDVNKPLPNL